MRTEAVEFDLIDIIFFKGVEDGFFRAGVGCVPLVLGEGLEGVFEVRAARGEGDARVLVGVVLPPRLAWPCLAPLGVLLPLALGDAPSGGLGIRLRSEQPMHFRADCGLPPVGRVGEWGSEHGDDGCDGQSSSNPASHGSFGIFAGFVSFVLDIEQVPPRVVPWNRAVCVKGGSFCGMFPADGHGQAAFSDQ